VTAALLLDPGGRPIIAHRGASGLAPENTLPAFDLAVAQGADGLELDVRLSADGVPVVCHDPTLDRTTDREGPVSALALEGLRLADAGARFAGAQAAFPYRGRGVTIPTLAQVLERHPQTPLLIELKVEAAAPPVQAELKRFGAAGRAVVASFSQRALAAFRQPPWLAGASRRAIAELAARAWLGVRPKPRGFRLYAVPYRYKNRIPVPTERFIAWAHRLGVPVHVWTVDDAETAKELWRRGANGMITNYPALLRAARERLGSDR
jgi:glycerophosphoryl diester phosphodiesterase